MTEALVQEMAQYGTFQAPKLTDNNSNDLHIMMKFQTKEQHDVANKVFENLIKMKMDVETYKSLICGLYYLYQAIEEEMAKHAKNDIIGPIYFPQEINRAETLERDLEHYCGQNWREEIKCPSTMTPYVQHIREISKTKPELLVAHAYVRYLGDLSGGQFIKRIVRRFYNIPQDSDNGVAFYDFSNINDVRDFKSFYRARMNTLELTHDQKLGLVEETRVAFDYNIRFLNQIEDIERSLHPTSQGKDVPKKGENGVNPPASVSSVEASKMWWSGHVDLTSAVRSTSVAVVALATVTLACPYFRESMMGGFR